MLFTSGLPRLFKPCNNASADDFSQTYTASTVTKKRPRLEVKVGYFWLCYSIMSVKKLFIGYVLFFTLHLVKFSSRFLFAHFVLIFYKT